MMKTISLKQLLKRIKPLPMPLRFLRENGKFTRTYNKYYHNNKEVVQYDEGD